MPNVLTVNGGSSSVRFAIFEPGLPPRRLLGGILERIGIAGTRLDLEGGGGERPTPIPVQATDHAAAVEQLLNWLERQPLFASLGGAGHRVVHGMERTQPELVSAGLLQDLRRIIPFDPEHLPREIEIIERLQTRMPALRQVVCFDTAFHAGMPLVATQLPIPRRYAASGVRRYGFHGLSYTYLMQELGRLGDPAVSRGRIILAHLGSGASVAAVRDGRSIDTSMGFTPAAGLLMGTRSGDIDPGVLFYLARSEGKTAAQLNRMLNHESGLRGVSATGSDVRDLLAREASDPRAAEALALFCYQAKKWIGSFAAALGGVDTLVFAGGIGEHAAPIRARICDGMEFLGIKLNAARNAKNAALISSGAVQVRVIATDEQLMIARTVARMLHLN
jgi:acetate kinase